MDQIEVYLMDLAFLAVLGIAALVAIFIKRGKYQKEAEGCIRGEIELPTGWTYYSVVECDMNAKSVTIDGYVYTLHPEYTRWGKHPLNPFMGIKALQVPIRVEKWFKDNTEPMHRPEDDTTIATAAMINAMVTEHVAVAAAMDIQEVNDRQKELTFAIANQPNKMVVYIGIGVAVLFSFIAMVIVAQLGGVI